MGVSEASAGAIQLCREVQILLSRGHAIPGGRDGMSGKGSAGPLRTWLPWLHVSYSGLAESMRQGSVPGEGADRDV
jgi:hypothetical protein